MRKLLFGLVAVASVAAFSFAWMGLEGGGLMPWQSFIIGAVSGPAMIKSCRELGVMD